MQRESKFRLFEKRESEMSENERRLRTEIDRLKTEKESRDMEFSKRGDSDQGQEQGKTERA